MASKTAASLKTNLALNAASFHAGMGRVRSDTANTKRSLGDFTKHATNMGRAIGAGLAGAYAASGALALKFANDAKEISRSAKTFGFSSAEAFQVYSASAKKAGIESDKFADMAKDLNEKLGEFKQTGSGGFADFFKLEGNRLKADDLLGLPTEQRMVAIQTELDRLNTSSEIQSFIWESIASDMTVVGKLLKDNGAEIKKNEQLLRSMGVILSDETIASLTNIGKNFDESQQALAGMGNIFVSELVPSIEAASKSWADFLKGADGLRNLASFLGGTFAAAVNTTGFALQNLDLILGAVATVAGGRLITSLWQTVSALTAAQFASLTLTAQFTAGVVAIRAKQIAVTALSRAYAFMGGPIGVAVSAMGAFIMGAMRTREYLAELNSEIEKLPARTRDADAAMSEYHRRRTQEAAEMAKLTQEQKLASERADLEMAQRQLRELRMSENVKGNNPYFAQTGVAEDIAAAEGQVSTLQAAVDATIAAIEDLKVATGETAANADLMSETQRDILDKLTEQNDEKQKGLALEQVAVQYGRDSFEYALAEAQSKRDAAYAAADKAVSDANGRAEVQEAAAQARELADRTYEAELRAAGLSDMMIAVVGATYDAEAGAWGFHGAMLKTLGVIRGIMGILNQLGAGMNNVAIKQEIDLIKNGVEPARAKIQVERETALAEQDRKMQAALGSGSWLDYGKLAIERGQMVAGGQLEDELATVTEQWNEANSSKGGGGGGSKKGGKGGGKGRLSEAERDAKREAEKQSEAYKDLQERLNELSATWGMTELELRIFNEQQKVGTAASAETVAAYVTQIDQLEKFKEHVEEARETFVDGFSDILTNARSARDVLGDVLSDMASRLADFAGNRAWDMLFGSMFSGQLVTGSDALSGALRIAIPGFANGVQNFGGGLAMVGERGRELVQLPKGSSVYNAQATKSMLSNSGAGTAIRVYVDEGLKAELLESSGSQALQIVQADRKEFERNGFKTLADRYNRDPKRKG